MPSPQTSNGTSPTLNAPLKWAQRKDTVLLTFEVQDCKNPTIDIQADKLHFKATTEGSEKHNYETELVFFGEVNPEGVRKVVSDLQVELVIPKKESGPFWPRLMKEKVKLHWLKVDFDKWKDEDEEEEAPAGAGADQFDLNSMMGQMGNFDERPDLGDDFADSDSEDLPDLEEDVAADDGMEASTSKTAVEESEEEKKAKAASGDAQPSPTKA